MAAVLSEWRRSRSELDSRGPRREWNIEERYLRKDGSTLWVHISGAVVTGAESSGPQRSVSVIQDIDARKRAEQSLEHNQRMLAQAQRMAHVGGWELEFDDD